MRNKMLKLSGAVAASWDDPAALWSQANGSAGNVAPVAATATWAAYRGPSLDLGVGGGAVNGHAGWALPICLWHWALKTTQMLLQLDAAGQNRSPGLCRCHERRCQTTDMHRMTCLPCLASSMP